MHDTFSSSPLLPIAEIQDEIGLTHFDYVNFVFFPWGAQSSVDQYSPTANDMECYLFLRVVDVNHITVLICCSFVICLAWFPAVWGTLLSGMLIPFIFLSLTRGIIFLVKILPCSLSTGK